MIKIFICFIFLVVFTLTQYPEILKARHECHLQRKKDLALLSREVCLDHGDRLQFKGMVDCTRAEERLEMSIPVCTVKTWINHTDLVSIYNKITESYWNILGFFIPTLFILLYFWQKKPAYHHRRHKKYIEIE